MLPKPQPRREAKLQRQRDQNLSVRSHLLGEDEPSPYILWVEHEKIDGKKERFGKNGGERILNIEAFWIFIFQRSNPAFHEGLCRRASCRAYFHMPVLIGRGGLPWSVDFPPTKPSSTLDKAATKVRNNNGAPLLPTLRASS